MPSVHDYTQDHDLAEIRAHALRQIRRTQIMSEIEELRTSKLEYSNRARISGAILLLGAGGYATLHYLLRQTLVKNLYFSCVFSLTPESSESTIVAKIRLSEEQFPISECSTP